MPRNNVLSLGFAIVLAESGALRGNLTTRRLREQSSKRLEITPLAAWRFGTKRGNLLNLASNDPSSWLKIHRKASYARRGSELARLLRAIEHGGQGSQSGGKNVETRERHIGRDDGSNQEVTGVQICSIISPGVVS